MQILRVKNNYVNYISFFLNEIKMGLTNGVQILLQDCYESLFSVSGMTFK